MVGATTGIAVTSARTEVLADVGSVVTAHVVGNTDESQKGNVLPCKPGEMHEFNASEAHGA